MVPQQPVVARVLLPRPQVVPTGWCWVTVALPQRAMVRKPMVQQRQVVRVQQVRERLERLEALSLKSL